MTEIPRLLNISRQAVHALQRIQAEPTCSPKVWDPPLSLSWSRRSSWHKSDLLLPGEESTRCSGRRGQVSSCLDVFKKCLSVLVGKRLREPSKLGNRKYYTSVNVILTAKTRGKWLSGRAGKQAAGPAAHAEARQPRDMFSLPCTGTYLLSSRY